MPMLPCVDGLLGQGHAGIEAADVPDHEQPAAARAAARIWSHSATLGAIGFSRNTCLPHCSASIAIWRWSSTCVVMPTTSIDRVGQQIVIVGVAFWHAEAIGHFSQPLGPPRANGRQFDARQVGQHLGMHLAEPTQTDDAPADRVNAHDLHRDKLSTVIRHRARCHSERSEESWMISR